MHDVMKSRALPQSIALFSALFLLSFSLIGPASARTSEAITTVVKTGKTRPKPGDPFSMTIVPREKSFVFLFYVDDRDHAFSLYPGQSANYSIISREDPLTVDSITNNTIKVDSKKGKLISVAVLYGKDGRKIKDLVLKNSDFNNKKPVKHSLSLTGKALIERLEFMRADHPRILHYLVEDAPQAMPL